MNNENHLSLILPPTADIYIFLEGCLNLLDPITPAAKEWVDSNINYEPALTMGGQIPFDPYFLGLLVEAATRAGLTVKVKNAEIKVSAHGEVLLEDLI